MQSFSGVTNTQRDVLWNTKNSLRCERHYRTHGGMEWVYVAFEGSLLGIQRNIISNVTGSN